MSRYFFRRLINTLPILFGISIVTFLLLNFAGGDPASLLAGKYATAERVDEIRQQLGLDQPLYLQYFEHLRQMLSLELGRSWSTQQPISKMIFDGLGPSLSLAVPAFIVSQGLSLFIALIIAKFSGSMIDRALVVGCLGLLSLSSLVYILCFQYGLAYKLELFPVFGWDSSWVGRWHYLALPVLIFTVVNLGSNILFYRSVFLDELSKDYVTTAKAKGLSDRRIMLRHVFSNGLVPIISLAVYQMPFLILGSILIESFFGLPGLGGMIYLAIQNADFPVIKAMTLFGALLYITFQLLSDWLIAVADPKIQLR